MDAIDANTVIFGIGPAGTGKTYLAMARLQALQSHEIGTLSSTAPRREGWRASGLPPLLPQRRSTRTCTRSTTHCDMLEAKPPSSWAGTIENRTAGVHVRGHYPQRRIHRPAGAQNTTAEQMKVLLTRLSRQRWSYR